MTARSVIVICANGKSFDRDVYLIDNHTPTSVGVPPARGRTRAVGQKLVCRPLTQSEKLAADAVKISVAE